MKITNKRPLVSCTVLSYNSAKTIVETLESIKAQTYQNIEIIVADDCSKDNTVEICRLWLEQNKTRFVRTELLTVEKNTGVCENSNRALGACKGEWRKGIAADDILLPNCVEDFVNYVHEHPEAKWVSSYMRVYKNEFKPENCITQKSVSKRDFFNLTAEAQLKKIAPWNLIAAVPNFYNVDVLRKIGGFDTRFSFEDYPLYITLLENGYKCYFMDKVTACYRIHESISNSRGTLFNYKFVIESKKFHQVRCFQYLSWWQKRGQYAIWNMQWLFERTGLNRDTPIIRIVYYRLHSFIRRLFNN